jgi:UDP-N-acetylmuramoylalanine--D-glutamate ligase
MGNACVIGLGKSGLAAARLLRAEGFGVTLSDRNDSEPLREQQQQLAQEGIQVRLGDRFTPDTSNCSSPPDLIVVSPGVPWDIPGLVEARSRGLDVVGELALARRYLSEVPWLCITGTNGKTTTTALVAAIFEAAGRCAPACGNIGYAACEMAYGVRHGDLQLDWAIAELSSYQIEAGWELKPQIALWTTFTPDHLSRHKTLENYYDIKAHLLDQAEQKILNGDDPHLRQTLAGRWPDAHWTSIQGREALLGSPEQGAYLANDWVVYQDQPIVRASSLKMQGRHNQQNLLMAVAAARLAGIEPEAIAEAIRTFPGVPHRLEHLGQWQGISFINDSKATNYDAAEVGLASVEAPAVLLAGGEAKEGEDAGWLAQIQSRAAGVVLFGAAADAFAARLRSLGYDRFECVQTLDQAVLAATAIAQTTQAKTILLSPACASFDRYPNFEARGDHFRSLCQPYFRAN